MGFLSAIKHLLVPVLIGIACRALAQEPSPPNPARGMDYGAPFFPDATYSPAIPTPESLLGFSTGDRALSTGEIERCLRSWDSASSRARLVEYARTYEGRPLFYMVITSRENLERLDTIQAGWKKLADPRGTNPEEADQLLKDLPAVAWLGYSIHGNETSGSNAAISVIYHLCASTGNDVADLLQELVVIIDPLENPDGRARAIKRLEEHRGNVSNVDHQSLLHTGYWPSGRTNHYLFDLNRDWILGIHPESRGRVRAISSWNPLLQVDAHEMRPLNTYLFSPAREPLNPNLPKHLRSWCNVFARDQARAFDRFGWAYYNGEWNEDWYPGYSTTWGFFHGAVGILYEQASIDEDAVRRPGGTLMTYRESVHHQIVSTMANLRTLQAHRGKMAREFVEGRRKNVDKDGPFSRRTFAVLPTGNRSRLHAFLELMKLQSIEVYTVKEEFSAPRATDQLGRTGRKRKIPPGTFLIPNRQPLAPLVSAMLEFDPRMSQKALEAELRELLRYDRSTLYDVTAWNITMMYGLESLTLAMDLPESAALLEADPKKLSGKMRKPDPSMAFVIDGADDASVAVAARLMERGMKVRVADRSLQLEGHKFSRGSLVIAKADNAQFSKELGDAVAQEARDFGLQAVGLDTGFGPGDLIDLGGEHVRLLEPPRVALASREGFHSYDLGSIWFTLDQRLGIESSQLDSSELAEKDLRSYNVLVLPDCESKKFPQGILSKIKDWVKQGGTLIAIGGSARAVASDGSKFGSARTLPECLENLDAYEQAVLREWLGKTAIPDAARVYRQVLESDLEYPWPSSAGHRPELKELKKRDAWQKLFMPDGTLLAGRVDDEHWLTFGTQEVLPVLFGKHPILMTRGSVEAPVRLGVLQPAAPEKAAKKAVKKKPEKASLEMESPPKGEDSKELPRIGWAALPEGQEMILRMSGLLWPEAAHRIVNGAWVTREKIGNGQVILFASPPTFRASTLGMARIFLNAVVYGPGLGAQQPIR